MTDTLDKFSEIARRIRAKRGPVALFGLFLRDDASDETYDLVVSAPWLDGQGLAGLRYLAGKLGEVLDPQEMLYLSRIVPMETTETSVLWLTSHLRGRPMPQMLTDFNFAGARIKVAQIFAIDPDAATPDATAIDSTRL